jgi:pimeloyl-ACP methyl ester carboxylesterase
MPKVTANGIQIEYDTYGDKSDPALLLINGLGMQMISWGEEFYRQFAAAGYCTIIFDNRDVGLTSKFYENPDSLKLMDDLSAVQRGEKIDPPYTLDDMTDDAIGLLDSLGIEKAHFCGHSMGGMIAQNAAIRYPSRVISLTSISSSTKEPGLSPASAEVQAAMAEMQPEDRRDYIEYRVNLSKLVSGTLKPDMDVMRDMGGRYYDRCHYPAGRICQTLAIRTSGSRQDALKTVTIPSLIIHGEEDPLLPIDHGEATAKAIPGAGLSIIKQMGHLILPDFFSEIGDLILNHTRRRS